MENTEKFLALFSEFDMIVVEKNAQKKSVQKKNTTAINVNQTKSELKKA